MSPTTRTNTRLLIASLAILAALHLGGCKKAPPEAAHDATPAKEEHKDGGTIEIKLTADAVARYGIKVDNAQLWQLRPTFVAPARVAFNAEAMAHVGSPLRGRAVDVKVKLGSNVKAGDELVVVESPELGEAQSDFLGKKTAAQTAVPAVELAKTAWERAKGLYDDSQAISLTEVQRREAEHKAAIAALKSAEAAAVAAENRLHLLGASQADVDALAKSGEVHPRFTIRAPIAGQVVERELTLGELVSPDREALLVIADTTVLWVLADIPEARVRSVAPGAKAWITVGGIDGGKVEGVIAFISPMVDAATRTAQVRIEVSTTGGEGVGTLTLKPGMFAQVEIVATDPAAPDPAAVIAVPAEAVQTVEGAPAVFVPVPKEENTFAKRPVTIGKTVGGLVPIYSGLVEGEQYVSAGTFILKAEPGKSAVHDACCP
jgi:cobalt-zinc-cadmium efflux system membrane fusion protein